MGVEEEGDPKEGSGAFCARAAPETVRPVAAKKKSKRKRNIGTTRGDERAYQELNEKGQMLRFR